MRHTVITGFLSVLLLLPAAADAASTGHEHHGSTRSETAPVDVYSDAMKKMHEQMTVPATGNPDVDFVRGMIPHHQGAIDMARIALEKSSDPFIRQLATDIVAAQEKEIGQMNDWLRQHGAQQ